ncbi:MAG: tyrosine--tRNA ligase [bacterium]|nr:tyrosine--tRNA ligase [bacterium]
MSDIFSELQWRGLIHQTTADDALPKWLAEKPRTLYVGFDPTSDSLHAGSLLPLMTLRRFQKFGHRPIALVGGATGMIGDPSGKSKERNLLDADQLAANVAGIEQQMRTFLDFEAGDSSAKLVNNFDWMRDFSYLAFLRDVGKNFPVNVMLAKESVKNRIGRDDVGISYTEFSYMLLQAYDFVHLNREFGCELQFGGSDQWGNITAGIDLARRMHGQQLYGVTCPLLTKSDGEKMGKTNDGALWLSPEKTSPYQFYQYWINVADEDVGKCLRFLTELSQEQVEALDASREADPGRKESQRTLAAEVTRLVHGDAGLAVAEKASSVLFGGSEITDLSDLQLGQIFKDVPSVELSRDRLQGDGLSLIDAFAESGLVKSKSEARRAINDGGAYVNNRRSEGIETMLSESDLASETVLVLRRGKKKYALLRFT